MRSVIEYSQLLHNQIGNQYLYVLILLAMAMYLVNRLRKNEVKRMSIPWLYSLAVLIAMISPTSYLLVMKLHIGAARAESVFFMLPVIPLAAVSLLELYDKLHPYIRQVGVVLAVFVLLIASQPWRFTKEQWMISNPTTAKVSHEVIELSDMIGEGGVVAPPEIQASLREINTNIRVQPEDVDGADYNQGIDYICSTDYEYYVVRSATLDELWLDVFEFTQIGNTEHYHVFRRVNK